MSELGLYCSPPSEFGLINARDQKYHSTMEANRLAQIPNVVIFVSQSCRLVCCIVVKKISDYEQQKRQ